MKFMNDFGLITGRDPKGVYPPNDRRNPQSVKRYYS